MKLFRALNRIKLFFYKIRTTNQRKERSEQLASSKRLKEAFEIAEEVLLQWSLKQSILEKIIYVSLFKKKIKELEKKSKIWKNKIEQAEKWASQARKLEASDTGNPLETEGVSKAINFYRKSEELIFDAAYQKSLNRLEQTLSHRNSFKKLFTLGKSLSDQGFYKKSLNYLLEAQEVFNIENVQELVAVCHQRIPEEEKYELQLNQCRQIATEGHFQEALIRLKPTVENYLRSDGKELLEKLECVSKGKNLYLKGLTAEKEGDFFLALTSYKQAYSLLPELEECRFRLIVLSLKVNRGEQALSFLEGVAGDRATYLRGFTYAQQGKLQKADREWQSISNFNIQPQREILKVLANRDRLQRMQIIEKLVDAEDLEAAKIASINFIDTYGIEPTIQSNLEEHIKPRLENYIWQNKDWQKITSELKGNFTQTPTVTLLHNWAIANYYQAQVEPSRITNWITTWFTALANLHLDPALQNITWLRNDKVDLEVISGRLIKQVEERIDKVKDSNLEEYLKLRDCYRLDKVAFFYFKNNPGSGLRVNECLILPGCYQSYSNDFSNAVFPAETWGTLYTNWGKAVAACLDGDTGHAIQIKPVHSPNTDVEKFAQIFVSYYEGRYYLDNKEWRKAVKPLTLAKGEIEKNLVWSKEIDLFCQKNREKIDRQDIRENLQFAEFWDNLLSSQLSKSYLVEYRTEEVREQLVNKTINFRTALQRLKAVKSIDPNNPVLLDFIKNVEIAQEGEEIDRLLSRNKFEEAVQRAKRSRHDRIRYLVAEMCIEILLDGAESRRLPYELIIQLGRWAYELCPNEPAFKPIYNQLGIYY